MINFIKPAPKARVGESILAEWAGRKVFLSPLVRQDNARRLIGRGGNKKTPAWTGQAEGLSKPWGILLAQARAEVQPTAAIEKNGGATSCHEPPGAKAD